jgi:hypothetical protein
MTIVRRRTVNQYLNLIGDALRHERTPAPKLNLIDLTDTAATFVYTSGEHGSAWRRTTKVRNSGFEQNAD